MAKRTRLIDTLQEEEIQELKENQEKDNSIVERKAQISAKVNMKMYSAFTTINKRQGVSNNSAINMLIANYVRENRDILEDDGIF